MIRRFFLELALLALSFGALAGNLTPAQIAILRPVVLAEPTLATARLTGDDATISAWCNAQASPAFTVWKTNVSITAVGDKINGTELAGLSSLNTTRLQVVIQLSPSGINPALADRRQFFDDIFSGAGGTTTRANLLALWKRTASRAEKALATGTGSDASPATLTWEGALQETDGARLVFRDNGTLWGC